MLNINSLYNERISIINGNKLPIIVNAYNSSSSIKSINYRIINKRGHTLYSRKLNKKTNFTWSDECVLANDYLNISIDTNQINDINYDIKIMDMFQGRNEISILIENKMLTYKVTNEYK